MNPAGIVQKRKLYDSVIKHCHNKNKAKIKADLSYWQAHIFAA